MDEEKTARQTQPERHPPPREPPLAPLRLGTMSAERGREDEPVHEEHFEPL